MDDISIREFLEKLGSNEPAPGGGGAAAMAGALAAALASMVANLTIGKDGFKENEKEMEMLREEAGAMEEELLQAVAEDVEAFKCFMACLKMPKGTADEKEKRIAATAAAATQAVLVPFKIARSSLEVLRISVRLAEIGNPNVITDAACSAIIAFAAIRSAAYNVGINLKYTKDEKFNKCVSGEMENMTQYAASLEDDALSAVDAKLDA
ncbi:MAG: cyclodeaminase/cyclohydrolase family protein [Phascolarctobacterium sp.]|nr:cyclodeaminase/cyclohydrolase family protein [Phascolarctobacterium sp.]